MLFEHYLKTKIQEMTRDFTALGNSLILAVLILLFFGMSKTSLTLLIGLAAIDLLCNSIKLVFFKHRPLKKDYSNVLEKIDAASFPSIHAARAAFVYSALFTATSFPVNLLFLLLIFIVALTRVFLKKHYLIDVFFGLIIGGLGFFLWHSLF